MSNIGIIGYGFVGKAIENGFKPKHQIFIHDKYQCFLSLEQVILKSDIVFICVPTPMDSNYRRIDLTIIENIIKSSVIFSRLNNRSPLLVIKSTVIPGTTVKFAKNYNWSKLIFNPEFLTEANYLTDFINADRIVIGGKNLSDIQVLENIYKESFPHIKIFTTDSTTAEMVKYMSNTFLATKVIFANEMSELCQKLDIDYSHVKKMVIADHRIYNSHLNISPEKGFGGKCFPKDTVALLGLAKKLNVDLSVLSAAWKKNLKIRSIKDWESIPGAVSH